MLATGKHWIERFAALCNTLGGRRSMEENGCKSQDKKEMTLDCGIFDALDQSRVISVLSYYLTSLVNLSFCRFLTMPLFPAILPLHYRIPTFSNFFF